MTSNQKHSQVRREVEEYLEMHPLRVSHQDVIDRFEDKDQDKIENVLQQIVDEGQALKFELDEDPMMHEYQWTG